MAFTDGITAHDMAQMVRLKQGRRIAPDSLQKRKAVRYGKLKKTATLYHIGDSEAVTIKQRNVNKKPDM